MNIDLFSALFGGVLVGLGVYVGSIIAARLRPASYELTGDGSAASPLAVTPVQKRPRTPKRERHSHQERQAIPTLASTLGNTPATRALGNDVVLTLTASGFAKNEATDAVAACAGAERSTLDSWLRAALKNLRKGAVCS